MPFTTGHLQKHGTINEIVKFIARSRIRISQVILGVLLAGYFFDLWTIRTNYSPWVIVAVMLILSGTALRSWAAGIIRKNKIVAADGPYALTRHPLYLGSFLMTIGFLFLLGDILLAAVVTTVFTLIYLPAIIQEESRMLQNFPKRWPEYSARVSLFYPKKLSLSALVSGWSFTQWIKNGEYRSAFTVLFTLIVINLF